MLILKGCGKGGDFCNGLTKYRVKKTPFLGRFVFIPTVGR